MANRSRILLPLLLAVLAYAAAGCTAAFGPGYSIEKQDIAVVFTPAPEPVITIEATYRLRNSGNQPLSSLELRLPGRRSFRYAQPLAKWDDQALAIETSPSNPRNNLLSLPQSWNVSAVHTLRLSVRYQAANPDEKNLSFSADAFFLPSEGWSPQLLPARGIFATGGVPPKVWNLDVRVPKDFLVHLSGRKIKTSRDGQQQVIRAIQLPSGGYPFVVAGRYRETHITADRQLLNLWTRSPQDTSSLKETGQAISRAVAAYNAMFGQRSKELRPIWIVECPVVEGCFTSAESSYAKLISSNPPSAELASLDTVLIDPANSHGESIAAAAAPSLASSWLGYGRNPGFYEQVPPLAALPAFAASRGREVLEGPQVRTEIIRRVLLVVPARTPGNAPTAAKAPESQEVLRAKSLLFFYALQDRYGRDAFSKALAHMLSARRGGGFDLDDLISAFEEETHQNVAQFVRLWMKHPGVPDDFRSRYENNSAAISSTSKEEPQ